jgi:hypothetical protein
MGRSRKEMMDKELNSVTPAATLSAMISSAGGLADCRAKASGESQKYVDWIFLKIGAMIYKATSCGQFFVWKHTKLFLRLGASYAITTSVFTTPAIRLYFK